MLQINVFRRPAVLRKRKAASHEDENAKPIEVNTEATGVELHKDSKYEISLCLYGHLTNN